MPKINLPLQRFDAQLAATDASKDSRVVPMTFYAGATVLQFNWNDGLHNLKLSMDPGAVKLTRLNSGKAPFTLGHADPNDPMATLGVIGNAQIEGDRATAEVRFSKRPDVEPIFADVLDAIFTNVSVSATISKMKEVTQDGDKLKTFLATKWEPYAVALVGVSGDPHATFAASEQPTECEVEFAAVRATSPQETVMEETKPIPASGQGAPAVEVKAPPAAAAVEQVNRAEVTLAAQTAERTRVLELTKIANLGKLEANFAAEHVEKGTSIEAFRTLAFEKLAARSAEDQIQGHRSTGGRDEADTRRDGFKAALLNRANPSAYPLKSGDLGYEHRGMAAMGLLRVAEECVRSAGKNPNHMNSTEIAQFAMSTSDFPYILASTADASLKAGYAKAPESWKLISGRKTVNNFKTQNLLDVGVTATFPQVPESGEFAHGHLHEGKDTFKVLTYGQIINFTRQVIINDSLGALTDIPMQLGLKAGIKQATLIWAALTDNALLFDGVALFDLATHANYLAGGTAISVDSLGVGRKVMRAQTDLAGDVIDNPPKFLVVPAAKEQLALQYTMTPGASGAYIPVTAVTSNPWAGTLTVIAEPRLDATSATAWYLFADPAVRPVLIAVYLAGNEGVFSETRQGFDIDGVEWKARMDFGAGVVDYRGAYLNAGA